MILVLTSLERQPFCLQNRFVLETPVTKHHNMGLRPIQPPFRRLLSCGHQWIKSSHHDLTKHCDYDRSATSY